MELPTERAVARGRDGTGKHGLAPTGWVVRDSVGAGFHPRPRRSGPTAAASAEGLRNRTPGPVDDGRKVEVAMEGNEGVAGLAIFLGGLNSCNMSSVRHAGTAMRLPVSALTEGIERRGDLADLLMRRYVHALFMQVAQSGVCNRFHSFDTRLARWLMMTHDRTGTLELNATQISIASVLGVRRSTVTDAASRLLKQNIIDYRRGRIEIIDRVRLVDAACSCYGSIKDQYDSFLN